MRVFFFIVLFFLFCGSFQAQTESQRIIQQAQAVHDPGALWDSISLEFHIEEPRVPNPIRYSILELDNVHSTFTLRRNREDKVATYIVDQFGNYKALLDGKEESDPDLIEQYRLQAENSGNYARFYKFYYGLPMSLNTEHILNIGDTALDSFQNEPVIRIGVELHEPLISKYWNVFISPENFQLKGVEIIFPDDPTKGERIVFEGEYLFQGILFPRMRHWYQRSDDQYLGSDLIMR